jgi:hypothetical protein
VSFETDLVALLSSTFSGRLFPDTAPAATAMPYATWQQVGGVAVNPYSGAAPEYGEMRLQVNVWSKTRAEANSLMRTVESLLRPNPFAGRPIGALIAIYEETTGARGAQQDFSVWHSY